MMFTARKTHMRAECNLFAEWPHDMSFRQRAARHSMTTVRQEDEFLINQVCQLEEAVAGMKADADEARVVELLVQLCDFFTGDLLHDL
jgi:hypothetical protein